jgi:hypothetical protein
MTIPEAIEAMKRNVGTPDEAGAMLVLADVWEEREANVGCIYKHGSIDFPCTGGQVYGPKQMGFAPNGMQCWGNGWSDCPKCHGTGYVSNGNSARAEALRLLAECGKVGMGGVGYYSEDGDEASEGLVSDDWYMASCERRRPQDFAVIVPERLNLMDAYAAADQPTRERWARETRALVPGVDFEPPPVLSDDARSFLAAIQHIAEATR